MFELKDIEELTNHISLSKLYEIAKKSAQIGNEILKINYNKIQKISSPICADFLAISYKLEKFT